MDPLVVQLERQLWRNEAEYLDIDGYMGVLRACAFSRESMISLIKNDLFGDSSNSESEEDSVLITLLLRVLHKEYPPQWEAGYSLIREIIHDDGESHLNPGQCKEGNPNQTASQRIRCLDTTLLRQIITQAIQYTQLLADVLTSEEERLHYQMLQTVGLKGLHEE